ncbi:hypothetical protein [Comamonas sp. E6]|uniref:hypothetical protein n=1 Tax=Comamonas sp. E6 TaxID=364029 RepID=UPI0006351E69|nr:hypothetical protein [Comamonas sp. E6]GAO71641.1 hypothetical protein CSE6_017_30780 [Comamonas sp. E6]
MNQPETCEISQTAAGGKVDELAMLVRQLVHTLRKASPSNDLADRALDYLKRHGLAGTFLRGNSAFVPDDVPVGMKPSMASEGVGTSASASHPENVPAPAAVAWSMPAEPTEQMIEVLMAGEDRLRARHGDDLPKQRAKDRYRALLALAATQAAAPVVQPEPVGAEKETQAVMQLVADYTHKAVLESSGNYPEITLAQMNEAWSAIFGKVRALLATATGLPAQADARDAEQEVLMEHSGCGSNTQVDMLTVRLNPGDKVVMHKGRITQGFERANRAAIAAAKGEGQ